MRDYGVARLSRSGDMSRSITPQYKIIKQLTPDLTNAVKNDLCDLSNRLLSHGLITEENHEEFINDRNSPSKRASDLIRTVLDRIKSDVRHYTVFVGVLEEKEWYYESVLQKMQAHDEGIVVISQPTLLLTPRVAEREHSDSEASPFIQTPYVQYEDEYSAPRNLGRKPSLLDQCRDCIESKCDTNTTYIIICCCCQILMASLVSFSLGIVMYVFFYSGCHSTPYFLVVFVVGLATAVLFWLEMALLSVKCRHDMKCSKLLESKQNILIHITPWLFILLLWFCAYHYRCTT